MMRSAAARGELAVLARARNCCGVQYQRLSILDMDSPLKHSKLLFAPC
jgi:hypothetical protein